MRALLLISLIVVLGITANAQQVFQTFANDTVKGDTLVTAATASIPYFGIVTFDFNVKCKAVGDTVYIDFQGSNDNFASVKTISTTTHIQSGTAYTNYQLLANPATYLKYRITKRAYEISDTAYFTHKIFIFKR